MKRINKEVYDLFRYIEMRRGIIDNTIAVEKLSGSTCKEMAEHAAGAELNAMEDFLRNQINEGKILCRTCGGELNR